MFPKGIRLDELNKDMENLKSSEKATEDDISKLENEIQTDEDIAPLNLENI